VSSSSFFLKEMGSNCLIEFGVKIENPKQLILKNRVYIGKGTIFGSENNNGLCFIDDDSHIGRNSKIDHTGNIQIGKNVLLSEEVTIFSHTHGYNPHSKAIPINLEIQNDVWIGYRVVILESTKFIVKNSIIASSALLSKECNKEKSIYAGIPAKFLKEISS